MPGERDPNFVEPAGERTPRVLGRPSLESVLSFALAVALSADLLLDVRPARSKVHLAMEVGALCMALVAGACLWLRCARGAARPRRAASPVPGPATPDGAIDSDLWKAIGAATRADAAPRSFEVRFVSARRPAARPQQVQYTVTPEPSPRRVLPPRGPAVERSRERFAHAGRHSISRLPPRRGA
jgi:hypothetical protein